MHYRRAGSHILARLVGNLLVVLAVAAAPAPAHAHARHTSGVAWGYGEVDLSHHYLHVVDTGHDGKWVWLGYYWRAENGHVYRGSTRFYDYRWEREIGGDQIYHYVPGRVYKFHVCRSDGKCTAWVYA
jgi:hypothetical protein